MVAQDADSSTDVTGQAEPFLYAWSAIAPGAAELPYPQSLQLFSLAAMQEGTLSFTANSLAVSGMGPLHMSDRTFRLQLHEAHTWFQKSMHDMLECQSSVARCMLTSCMFIGQPLLTILDMHCSSMSVAT